MIISWFFLIIYKNVDELNKKIPNKSSKETLRPIFYFSFGDV